MRGQFKFSHRHPQDFSGGVPPVSDYLDLNNTIQAKFISQLRKVKKKRKIEEKEASHLNVFLI